MWRVTAFALAALAFGIYGVHLGDGFLSDDFVYAHDAGEGLGQLVRRLTVDSYPRSLRPLPALVWLLARLPDGAFFIRLVDLLLHWLNAFLLACAVSIRSRGPALPLLAGAAFCAFPLFTEAVLWPSSTFDLLATTFALAVVLLAARGSEPSLRGDIGAAALFSLGLLCKESILLLPLALPLLFPLARVRRLALILIGLDLAYLAARVFLLGGIGGYLTAGGSSLLWSISPKDLFYAVALQIPYRLVVPLKRAGELAPVLAGASLALIGAFLVSTGMLRKVRCAVTPIAATFICLLPVAPVLRVDYDHEGSRLLYFPVAIGILALVLCLERLPRRAMVVSGLLVAYWSVVTILNGSSWSAASRAVAETLGSLAELQARYPAESTVMVDAADTLEGAYVFRNGLPEAARADRLRYDLVWKRGTVASITDPLPRLGIDLFQIGSVQPGVTMTDRTACERDLRRQEPATAAGWPRPPAIELCVSPDDRSSPWTSVGEVAKVSDDHPLAVRLQATGLSAGEVITGRLYWIGRQDLPFTITDSRDFVVTSRCE